MRNIILTTTLLSLLTTPTLALPSNITLTPRESTPNPKGSCKTLTLPTEAEFNAGASSFCTTYFSTPQLVSASKSITSTAHLTAYDNKHLNWVYKVKIDCGGRCLERPQEVDLELCQKTMKDVLSEGKLGNEYCVVDGTQDVLFMDGMREGKRDKFHNRVMFESRRRKGD